MMNWKWFGRKRSWPNFKVGLLSQLSHWGTEENSKTTKNFSQDSRSPGRDLNPEPPECEAGVLTTRPRRSVRESEIYLKTWRKWPLERPRYSLCGTLNVVVEWLTLLLRIQEVPGSNLDQEVEYPDWGSSWFLPVLPTECQDSAF
jgi:hypothetical protein